MDLLTDMERQAFLSLVGLVIRDQMYYIILYFICLFWRFETLVPNWVIESNRKNLLEVLIFHLQRRENTFVSSYMRNFAEDATKWQFNLCLLLGAFIPEFRILTDLETARSTNEKPYFASEVVYSLCSKQQLLNWPFGKKAGYVYFNTLLCTPIQLDILIALWHEQNTGHTPTQSQ